jgi:hypothetical protein
LEFLGVWTNDDGWGYVSIEDKLAITARIPSPSFIATKKRLVHCPKKLFLNYLGYLQQQQQLDLSHKTLRVSLVKPLPLQIMGFFFLHSFAPEIES